MTRTSLLIAAVVTLAACPPAAPPPVPPGIDQPGQPGEPGAEPNPAPVIDAAPPVGVAQEGAACSVGEDCASGVCEGLGCGPQEGTCAPTHRGCTRDLATYCGCDGSTFRGSGSCPGQRFAHRGPCAAPLADGQPCESGDQCTSGVCEGQGCDRATPGICVSAGRMCTADVAPYCDCLGRTFEASSSCPGRRYRARGSCTP
jgi:hypothetical protein